MEPTGITHMFSAFIHDLTTQSVNDEFASRRQHPRRRADHCVCMIDDVIYPVENWSFGGVLIHAHGRTFDQDGDVDITLKFKIGDRIVNVTHQGHVIRKSGHKVAFQFLPLTKDLRKAFQNVINDLVTGTFAESQMS